ncbi:MAG: PAS domain-containing protein [Methylococcales bacterium]
MHEWLVHKVELEMQNEELCRAHAELEEARDRYVDLYEFAPIAYISIDREGMINEINLTGSTLLGVDRARLLKCRFSQFVAPQDKDRWYRLFMNMMQISKTDKQEFGLEMVKVDGSLFSVHLDCLCRETSTAAPILRIALADISKIQQFDK